MVGSKAYDSPAESAGSDLHSVRKRTNADLELYFTKLENGGRECRNLKKRKCVAKYISGKERGRYGPGSSTSTLWSHANDCFDLGARKKLPAGQKELFAANLYTKAQDDRLLQWIVDDQQAFSVVEVPSFRSFINGINPKYTIPSRKTVTRRIVSTYASRLNDMKSLLHALDCKVSLTYDVWTSKANLPYANVTVHYVDDEWKLRDHLLSFTYFPYPHTAQRHQDLVINTIQNFGLEAKVLACVILERDYKNSAFHPSRCAVHTMQLPLKKVFQECSKQLTAARDLVVLAKNSPKFSQRISEESIVTDNDEEDNLVDSFIGHVTLKLDTETRWSSTYTMLTTLLRMRNLWSKSFEKFYWRSLQLCRKLGEKSFWMKTTGPT
ncbi:ribonuclease H-like domain-containing protein [Lipomyces kononenkoae]|uniref:Ribonuclease H-like domain-containing protein n=1 Tax=Lipomyces kononenkoae TaxID=34357 RepID=A0ACC3SSI7_LIPKO